MYLDAEVSALVNEDPSDSHLQGQAKITGRVRAVLPVTSTDIVTGLPHTSYEGISVIMTFYDVFEKNITAQELDRYLKAKLDELATQTHIALLDYWENFTF